MGTIYIDPLLNRSTLLSMNVKRALVRFTIKGIIMILNLQIIKTSSDCSKGVDHQIFIAL